MSEIPTYNGPAMADWIEGRIEFRKNHDDGIARVVRHWRSGTDPLETTVDGLLCKLGIHLSEVPAWAITGWPKGAVQGLRPEFTDGRLMLVRAA